MKINIWVPREDVWELNAWLGIPWEESANKHITFFHHKPIKEMDLVQVTIHVDEYQKIIDNNEEIQENIAEQIGWVQTTTNDPQTDAQLQLLFGD